MKKLIILLFTLFCLPLFGQTAIVDSKNSLSGALTADSAWSGQWVDLMARNAESVSVFAYSDSASATNGLIVYFSPDGITSYDSLHYSVAAASASDSLLFTPRTRFYKIKYINGTKATHITIIQPILRPHAKGY